MVNIALETAEDKCSFPLCGRKSDRGGYCLSHAKYFSGPKPKKQPIGIAKVSDKRKAELKEQKPARDEQNEWFARIEQKECPALFTHCWNCGERIFKAFMRAAMAHVLPKRKNMFPSVKTHPDNYLILGSGCGCHQEYDRSWDDASKMQVWPRAVEKFELIYPAIAEEEKKHIPEALMEMVT